MISGLEVTQYHRAYSGMRLLPETSSTSSPEVSELESSVKIAAHRRGSRAFPAGARRVLVQLVPMLFRPFRGACAARCRREALTSSPTDGMRAGP
jgi:hypothetical protein